MLIGDLYVLLKFLTRYTFYCFAVPTYSMCWLIFFLSAGLNSASWVLSQLHLWAVTSGLQLTLLFTFIGSCLFCFLGEVYPYANKEPMGICPQPYLLWIFIVKLDVFILHPQKINKPWWLHYLTFAFMLDQKQNSSLSYYTRYTPSELRGCVRVLHQLFRLGPGSNLPAIREKYSQHKVSLVYIMWLLMGITTLVPTLMLNALPSICSQYKFVAKKYCPPSIPTKFFQDLIS
jgi:hypothetical protein